MPTSAELKRVMAAIESAVIAMSKGEEPADDPAQLLDEVLESVRRDAHDPFLVADAPTAIAARRMRDLRLESGDQPTKPLRQEDLADAMTALGCEWRRGTVTETEQDRRRLTVDELLALALLFGVPLVELLVPAPGEMVVIGDDGPQLTRTQMRELLIGRRGVIGTGGPAWLGAVLPAEVNRPAKQLWARRNAAEREGK